jgi:ribosome-associated translation inhibitor RaiA
VLETPEAREFIGLFGDLHANRAHDRALRQAGHRTAKQYTWSQITQRILLPRLRLATADSFPKAGGSGTLSGKGAGTRHRIQGQHTSIAPPLLAWIGESLEDLNAPSEDVRHADVTLVKHCEWRRSRDEACVEVALADRIVQAAHVAKTPYEAMVAALNSGERQLRAFRARGGMAGVPIIAT